MKELSNVGYRGELKGFEDLEILSQVFKEATTDKDSLYFLALK